MKISIVIPSNNEAEYVETLTAFIIFNSKPENIEEIIIVESFNTERIVKIAEKSHAKLYYNFSGSTSAKMDAGAFQAKGEVIYFIKPGCIPPVGFDERIIRYAKEKYALGCFDYEKIPKSDNFLLRAYKKICALFYKGTLSTNSFFVTSKLYYQTGGLKQHSSYLKLKKEILHTSNKFYL